MDPLAADPAGDDRHAADLAARPAAGGGAGDPAAAARRDDRPLARLARRWRALDTVERWAVAVDALVVAAATLFVLVQLSPSLLIADTTPAGGDMGAHVWGPAHLRDELLPDFRLAGWAPDWYAGFPAYHFYMVVPALLIVVLDAGLEGWAALLPLAVAAPLGALALASRRKPVRRVAAVAAVAVAVPFAGLPYGVAFKWVSVAGLVALPAACYVAARLADLPFPGPPLVAVGSVVFLFNREPTENGTGNIIGGNVTSTLAGEFSFSLSLLCLVLYTGFLLRGLRRGGHRATCAVLLALTALCHVIPAIYAIGITAVALAVSVPLDRRRLLWFAPIGVVGVALSAFWTLPFAGRRAYLNDMGWEKLPAGTQSWGDFLWPDQLKWLLALAAVGAVVSVVLRIRLGVLLAACAAGSAAAFWLVPQGRLWNARILPLYVLCLCLLAAVGVAELGRAIASLVTRRPERAIGPVTLATPVAGALAAWVAVALPLGVLPGVRRVADDQGNVDLRWLAFEVDSSDRNSANGWAEWNYSGYERKDAYPEYHGLIELGRRIGEDPELGCGRVMWEYESDVLDRYGTPMAPMLLPFWTDGCMQSMEGLYFEASATTPYHFLTQRALSAECSCAQRDLPYGAGFDIDLGVRHLQRMGVRYYFAFTETAVTAADAHPDLTPIGESEPWHAYLVAGVDLVEPLRYEPAVLTGLEPGMSWVGPASKWWQDPTRWDVPLAEDGPSDWQRVPVTGEPQPEEGAGQVLRGSDDDPGWTRLDVAEEPERRPLPEIEVTNVEVDGDRIAFDVSEPGVPVLVKVSYFPNWKASGAEGPYRVTPNHMVVVPTSTHVELTYGWTALDLGAYGISALGVAGAVLLARRPGRREPGDDRLFLDGPDPAVEDGDGAAGEGAAAEHAAERAGAGAGASAAAEPAAPARPAGQPGGDEPGRGAAPGTQHGRAEEGAAPDGSAGDDGWAR